MGDLILFILFSFSNLHIEAANANYPSTKCNHGEPDIQSPFRLQGQRHDHCGNTTFDLHCKLNKTTIHFPAYGDLVVKSISYDIKKLNLLDPKKCVHQVFLNLDLSLTPFQYYYVTKNYTYLNCSARISPSFQQVPCLSGSEYHVYVVEASIYIDVPKFCEAVKTVAIPFSYSAYISDDSFGLGLTWDLAGSNADELKGGSDMAYGKVLGIGSIFVVVTMISAKTYFSKKTDRQNEDGDEKLLADGETVKIEI